MTKYFLILLILSTSIIGEIKPPIGLNQTVVAAFGNNIAIPLNDNLIKNPFTNTREIYLTDEHGVEIEGFVFGEHMNEFFAFKIIGKPDYHEQSYTIKFHWHKNMPDIMTLDDSWGQLLEKTVMSMKSGECGIRERQIHIYERKSGRAKHHATSGFHAHDQLYQNLVKLFTDLD